MSRTDARRQALIEKIADHLLSNGLQGASLRPLAAAAGTSDRMLLHYFKDKDQLLSAALMLLSHRLLLLLEQARGAQLPFESLLQALAGMLKDSEIRPYLRLWLELASGAASGNTLYRDTAGEMCRNFFEWISAAIAVQQESDRAPLASLALATLEGCVLLDMVGAEHHVSLALEGLSRRQASV